METDNSESAPVSSNTLDFPRLGMDYFLLIFRLVIPSDVYSLVPVTDDLIKRIYRYVSLQVVCIFPSFFFSSVLTFFVSSFLSSPTFSLPPFFPPSG